MKKKQLPNKRPKNIPPAPTGTFESQIAQAYMLNYLISPADGPEIMEEDLAILHKFLLSANVTGNS